MNNMHLTNVWLIILCAAPILLSQAIWIFFDARKRGENQWLWGIIGLINCPSSLIVYLLVTRPGKIRCKGCGKDVKKGYKSCPHCGMKLYKTCSSCGREVDAGWEFCPYCSVNIKEE
jgi:RNA polymerase subunit RPABC4/transcription elongation factor Spt4